MTIYFNEEVKFKFNKTGYILKIFMNCYIKWRYKNIILLEGKYLQ